MLNWVKKKKKNGKSGLTQTSILLDKLLLTVYYKNIV